MLRQFVVVLAVAAPAAAQVNFSGLGRPPGADTSVMTAVSADGRVALGTMFAPTPPDVWVARWTDQGGSERLVEPSNLLAPFANGINSDGSVIVGSGYTNAGLTGYRWTRESGYVLTPGYGFRALSDDAHFIVGNQHLTDRPFRWSEAGGYQFMGDNGTALRASADGSVVIGANAELPGAGWRWTASTGQVSLGDLPLGTDRSEPADISADGSTIVGYAWDDLVPDPNVRPYRWTPEGGYDLLAPLTAAMHTYATGVAADGRTIVGTARFDNSERAVIWTQDGEVHRLDTYLESLGADLSGWTLVSATGISDDGLTIIGNGLRPGGLTEGWIVQIPTPSSALVLALFLRPRRRRG